MNGAPRSRAMTAAPQKAESGAAKMTPMPTTIGLFLGILMLLAIAHRMAIPSGVGQVIAPGRVEPGADHGEAALVGDGGAGRHFRCLVAGETPIVHDKAGVAVARA